MKLSLRHLVGSALLIVAVVISYDLVESLQGGPCPGEGTGWIVGNLIASAFVLYFFAGFRLVVARKYLVMAISTLWAWHLLVLSPFLANTCMGYRNLDTLRQVLGFGFREFVIASVLVATASSCALFLRYRTVDNSSMQDRRTFLRLAVAGAAVVSVVLVAGMYWIVPLLRDAYSTFGADLPVPTLVLIKTYQYWLILPCASVAGYLYVRWRDQYCERQLQIALNAAVGLIFLLNIASGTFIFSALAPLMTLCSCI